MLPVSRHTGRSSVAQWGVLAVLGLLLAACTLPASSSPSPASPASTTVTSAPAPSPSPAPQQRPIPSPSPSTVAPTATPHRPATPTVVVPDNLVTQEDAALYDAALRVLRALQQHNGTILAAYADLQGVTFSPDVHVDATDRTFRPNALRHLWNDPTLYTWGTEPGSGQPIQLTFSAYAERLINDRDYAHAPRAALDRRLGQGSTIDNVTRVWPAARFVEFHYPGTAQYGGLDWTSLRLVFVKVKGMWRLRGVLHDAWTP